jgi:hypothetical protein
MRHVIEHSVEVFRRIIDYRVDLGIGPYQYEITRLRPLGKHTRYDVLSLSPYRHIAMRIVLCDPTDIFKVRRVDQAHHAH